MDLVTYGTLCQDNIIQIEKFPVKGDFEPIITDSFEVAGEAVSPALFLSKWGKQVRIIGNNLGKDVEGDFILKELSKKSGIDISYIKQSDNVRTPYAKILSEKNGDRTIIGYFDNMEMVTLEKEHITGCKFLSIDEYHGQDSINAYLKAKSEGMTVITADSLDVNNPLAFSDVNIVSSFYLKTIYSNVNPLEKIKALQEITKNIIILTDGPNKIYVIDQDSSCYEIFPYKIENIIDTTGAGDSFKSGLIFGLMNEWDLEKCIKFAAAVAGHNCLKPGAAGNILEVDVYLSYIENCKQKVNLIKI